MSLGYARDSIADLQKYYNTTNNEDDKLYTTPPAIGTASSSQGGSLDGSQGSPGDDDFLFFDADEDDNNSNGNGHGNSGFNKSLTVVTEPLHLPPADSVTDLTNLANNSSSAISSNVNNANTLDFHTSSNRKFRQNGMTTTSSTSTSTTPSNGNGMKRSPSVTSTSRLPSTYRSTPKVATQSATQSTTQSTSTAYSGFNYNNSSYQNNEYSDIDYNSYGNAYAYADPYGVSGSNSHTILGSNNNNEKKNIFCCFFPNAGKDTNNYKKKKNESDSDSDSSSDTVPSLNTSHHNDNETINTQKRKNTKSTIDNDNNNNDNNDQNEQISLESDVSMDASHHGLNSDYDDLSLSASSSYDQTPETPQQQTLSSSSSAASFKLPPTPNLMKDATVNANANAATSTSDTPKNKELTKDSILIHKSNSSCSDYEEDDEEENKKETKTKSKTKQTSKSTSTSKSSNKKKLNNITLSIPSITDDKKPLKSILKRTVMITNNKQSRKNKNNNNNHKNKKLLDSISPTNDKTKPRRSILPSYESSNSTDEDDGVINDEDDNNNNHYTTNSPSPQKQKQTKKQQKPRVSFSPMARVISVTARDDMSFFVKSCIWWQRNDYDDFKKTGRIIAKAMLCGGSEIWLQTSNAWGKKQGSTGNNSIGVNNTNGGNTSLMNKGKMSNGSMSQEQKQYMSALKKYGVTDTNPKEDDMNEEKDEDVGSKWWCKFGHSRRGLEHIVSIEEGRSRQRFVNIAIRAVLDEQRRQRLTRRDPNKIAAVAMQYTSWARDLSAAAGAADAEAVQSNFNSKAKCRIHHLTRNLNGRREPIDNGHAPSATFILSCNTALTAKVLDANTHTHSRLRMKRGVVVPKNDNLPVNVISKKAAGFQFQSPIKPQAEEKEQQSVAV